MENYTDEIWKDIEDCEDRYEVSNYGRVRNKQKDKFLKLRKKSTGYLTVSVTRNGKYVDSSSQRGKNVHRLVAQAFISNPENKPCVNHLDSNRANNYVDNLEWTTIGENQAHRYLKTIRKKRMWAAATLDYVQQKQQFKTVEEFIKYLKENT